MSGPEGPVAAKHGVRERPPGEARSSAETEDGQPRGEIPEKPKSKRAKRRRGRRGRGGARPPEAKPAAPKRDAERSPQSDRLYAALDLGTNNCRLLIARRAPEGFKVVDAYSRIVRLGEGLAGSGALSDAAMARAIDALRICAEKMKRRGVTRARTIATAACRTAANGEEFIARVRKETGLSLEIVSTEDEARLAVAGCAPLLDSECTSALVFDIGGGSTELIWVRLEKDTADKCRPVIGDWVSLPCGVVTLAERHGGV
ncbi:Ppx/GppA phosphatase family protein, partial [Parvibaculum sp.]